MDHGDQGRSDDGRATPAGGPPNDWDRQFADIVSGINGDMKWSATTADMDANAAAEAAAEAEAEARAEAARPPVVRAPQSIWSEALPDTAEDRRARREMRRAERAESLAAFRQAQEELEAARAADTEHYERPEPPRMQKLKRRTVAALALILMGLVLIVFPQLLPASFELIAVLGALLVLGGGWLLLTGIRRHRTDDGWDDGSRV